MLETDAFQEWDAVLEANPGFAVRGSARANSGFGQTATAVSIAGAPDRGVHPWHIHAGSCGSDGPIVGDAGAYPALSVGSDGTADESAQLDVELMSDADYYVNIHASPNDLGTIVACGRLFR